MSMEAQFYEARRRQSAIDRRQSFQSERDNQRSDYDTIYIPVRVLRPTEKLPRCTCTAAIQHRPHMTKVDHSVYRRDRDIYPRPVVAKASFRRHALRPVLHHRFTSVEYLQQW